MLVKIGWKREAYHVQQNMLYTQYFIVLLAVEQDYTALDRIASLRGR